MKECLKRAVLQDFARRVEQAIADYPSSLTDEQLKQVPRSSGCPAAPPTPPSPLRLHPSRPQPQPQPSASALSLSP